MKVKYLYCTPLIACSTAIRKCYNSGDKSDNGGPKDLGLIDRIGNRMKHESVKNHINFTIEIDGVSTKTLLALTRHDVGTEFSVESTRFTCKKNEMKYTLTENEKVNEILISHMKDIIALRRAGVKCDDLAMLLPQAYQYSLVMTISLTALQHFLNLRLKNDAHWDIRDLAKELKKEIPTEYKYLFDTHLSDNTGED